MTNLEIILSTLLWIALTLWIFYKRNWYQHYDDVDFRGLAYVIGTLVMPLNLIVILFREFVLKDWTNEKII